LLAADGQAVVVPSDPELPVLAQRWVKFIEIPGHPNLMIGNTGAIGDAFDLANALSTHPLDSWAEVIAHGRDGLINANNAAKDRAERAGEPVPQKSSAMVAGFVRGKAASVKFVADGTAAPVFGGPCFVGIASSAMPGMIRFAGLVRGSYPIKSKEDLGSFLEAITKVMPEVLLPIDTWELVEKTS
jgi:hypothetical protein